MKRIALLVCLFILPAVHAADKAEVDAAVKLLKSKKAADRPKGLKALAALGEDAKEATAAVLEIMVTLPPTGYEPFLDCIEKINPKVHKHVVTIAVDKDERLRNKSIKALRELGTEAAGALPLLMAVLTPGNPLRAFQCEVPAMNAIAAVAPEDKNAIAAVCYMLASGSRHFESIAAAREMKIPTKNIVEALTKALGGKSVSVIESLASYGEEAKGALPVLNKLKLDTDANVRDAAVAAIAKIKG